jgi:hypothetical protein
MFILNGRKYTEDPSQKLGAGSEGTIYSLDDNPNKCVKIFHPADLSDTGSVNLAKYRAKKVKSICSNKLILPKQFIMPDTEVYNSNGDVIGFTMPKLRSDFVKLKKLLEKDFRLKNNITLSEITILFARLFEDYSLLQGKIDAIGDVNTGSLMITSNMDLCWVDTDSYAYKGFPSLATTELFCHPDLYINLDKTNSTNASPKSYHDTFSFTIMYVLMALWGAHPFRMGTHPKYMGLQERTKNGITIFDSDVSYPPILPSPEILSDELLGEITDILKQKTTKPLDFEHLKNFAQTLTLCKSCGIKYYALRTHCPACKNKTIVDILRFVSFLIDERFFEAPGTILYTQLVDEKIYVVCRIYGKLKLMIVDSLKNVSVIDTDILSIKGATYGFFNSYFVVCNDPYSTPTMDLDIYKIDGKNLLSIGKSSTIGLENGEAIYATSCRFLYRIAGGGLMKTDLMGNRLFDKQVTQVFKGQTWFTVDSSSNSENEIIFGFDRALRDYQWFIIVGDKKGDRYVNNTVKLPVFRKNEKLEDFVVYFNPKSVLLVQKTIYRGKSFIRYFVIGFDGVVKKDVLIGDNDVGYEFWENISGKLYQNSSILHVTVNGVVKQDLNNDSYSPLKDTFGIIGINDSLAKFGSKIYVSRNDTILTISKK